MTLKVPKRRNWLEAWSGRAAQLSYRRPWSALLVGVLLCAMSLVGARSLTLDADLARLLPARFESVQSLQKLQERLGASGAVVVVLRGKHNSELRDYAEQLAPSLQGLSGVRYVDYQRPVDWFRSRSLFFLERDKLEQAAEQLEERVDWEILHRNPLYVDLEDEGPPPLDYDNFRPGSEGGPFGGLRATPYYESEDGQTLVLFVRPRVRSTDVTTGEGLVSRIQTEIDGAPPPSGVSLELTGRLVKKLEQKHQLAGDLGLTSAVALLLMVGYLVLHFFSARALLLLSVPHLSGLLFLFGIVGSTYGSLNILTAFVGAILLGLGLDHGIHLLGSYEDAARREGHGERAVVHAFSHTGRAVLVATLTTALGFSALAISDFRAFREFGVAAASGMLTITFAFLLLMPALLRWFPPGAGNREAEVVPHRAAATFSEAASRPRHWRWLLVGSACLSLAMLAGVPQTHFNYDFAALEDPALPAAQLDKQVNQLLGYSQTPTVVLTETLAQEQAVAGELRKAKSALGALSSVDRVATLADAVPNAQEERQPTLARITRALSRLSTGTLTPEQQEQVADLKRMAAAPVFTRRDLPAALRDRFSGDSAPETAVQGAAGAVLVYPAISLSDGARVPEFAKEVRAAAGGLPVAGDAMIMADILLMVQKDGRTILVVASASMLLALALLLARLRHALAGLGAGVLTVLCGVGAYALLGGQLNYLNIVAIPVLFGISVDGTVHLLTTPAVARPRVIKAVAGALVTTGLGFAALLLADHPGLVSLGQLATLGLLANGVVSLGLVPAVLTRMESNRPANANPSSTSADSHFTQPSKELYEHI